MKQNFTQLTLLLFLSLSTLTGFAGVLTPEEALQRIKGPQIYATRGETGQLTLSYTLEDSNSQPSLYIFTNNSGGFVVASADDSAFPVLGYSDSGEFDPDNIPAELQYWLSTYSREIELARESNYSATPNLEAMVSTDMEAIAPLLTCKWNQGAPYNDYCYTIAADGTETKSVTGCVATAMAQVMYYFKYPEIGHGEISYKHGDSGTYSMNFGEKAFDWDQMLPTYYPGSYTSEEADAVAYLMKACGYSVKMDYGKGESGANGANIAGALIDYFGYNTGISLQTRKFYTYDEWVEMIYSNLKNVGPVVYDGSALDGGHSFVCDGYDGNGYFHINWGWGGMSDGYYLLDALNPDEFGIGGAAGGFNLGQQVILNITPKQQPESLPTLMQFGNVTGKISGHTLTLSLEGNEDTGFQYINPAPLTVTFGIKIENITDPNQAVQYLESDKKNNEAKQGSFFKWDEYGTPIDLDKLQMTQGDEYNVIISTYLTQNSVSGWQPVTPVAGKYNYVSVRKTSDGYEVKNYTVDNLTVSDFKIVSSPVYYDMPVKFSATFTNESSVQLTRNYSAVLFDSDGKECYKMENYSINVDEDSNTNATWTSVQWYKENDAKEVTEPTEFTVKLYDNWEGEYVEGIEETVTVNPSPKQAKVETEFTITNGVKEGDVYVIEGNELSVSLTVKVLEGFFNHTIMLAIQAPMENGDYETVMHKHFDAIPDLSAGQEQVLDMSVVFESAQSGKEYRVEVWGPGADFDKECLVRFNLDMSGIQKIRPDNDGLYHIFTINGSLMRSTYSPDSLNTLAPGIYIINGVKIIR